MSQSANILITSPRDLGTRFYGWLAIIGAGLLVGLYGLYRLMTEGTIVLGIEQQFPWGALISTYEYLMMTSMGVGIGVVSIAVVFGAFEYERLVKRGLVLSVAAFFGGGASIFFSLGLPFNTYHLILTPNLASPLFWMIVFYAFYLLTLLFLGYIVFVGKSVTRRTWTIAGTLLLVAGVGAASNAGGIFGLAETRPYWGGAFGPLYFVLTAILSGIASILLVTIVEYKLTAKELDEELKTLLTGPVAKSLALVVGVTLLFKAWKLAYGLSANNDAMYEAYSYMAFGPPAWWFWGIVIGAGLIVPLVILLNRSTRTVTGVFIASALVMVKMYGTRIEELIGGQVIALNAGTGNQYPIVTYAPSPIEMTIVVFAAAVFALVYTLGYLLLDMDGALNLQEIIGERELTPTGGDGDD